MRPLSIMPAYPVLLLGLVGLVSGCQKSPTSPISRGGSSRAAIQSAHRPQSIDEVMSQISLRLPSFGGLYIADGQLVVYLTDLSKRSAATPAIEGFLFSLGSSRRERIRGVIFRPGQYTFQQLSFWRLQLEDRIDGSGIVYTDIDERENRVAFGVSSSAAKETLLDLAEQLHIPAEAVEIRAAIPITEVATLQDYVRPLAGGLRIQSTKGCTLGFLATLNGAETFVTASHCTNTEGGVENTIFSQPDATFGTIGLEYADPVFSAALPNCMSGRTCRYSDSAAIELTTGQYSFGDVYKTSSFGQTSGSITIADTFKILLQFDSPSPMMGEVLNKMGSTTGWTRGTVIGACMNLPIENSRELLCQDKVDAGVNLGDSGSPVFWGGGRVIEIYGVVWAGGSPFFYFSNMTGIEKDLGSLQTIENP